MLITCFGRARSSDVRRYRAMHDARRAGMLSQQSLRRRSRACSGCGTTGLGGAIGVVIGSSPEASRLGRRGRTAHA